MPTKVRKISKIIIFILLLPVIVPTLDFVLKFILQLGRVTGTIIRLIMNL